jgi:endonuclease YncB( thermonuclease family)
MNKAIQTQYYERLLEDIKGFYDVARHALVEAYWKIGRRIVEEEQNGHASAAYGDHLLLQLSQDLSATLGRGFSKRNLYNMRQFYLTHEAILQDPAKLTWSQHVELLPIKNKTRRRRLEKQILSQKLSYKQIRQVVQGVKHSPSETPPSAGTQPEIASLAYARADIHSFTLVDKAKVPYPRGKVVVDCGFNIWRSVPRADVPRLGEASYTYPATVESVIDGDTLWAVIDCGFDTLIREKLRFWGIDAPESGTPEGDKAGRYVTLTLKACSCVVIQTHKSDKYDRYLSDIFYLPKCNDPDRIGREGHLLNQSLLDKGLARPWKA